MKWYKSWEAALGWGRLQGLKGAQPVEGTGTTGNRPPCTYMLEVEPSCEKEIIKLLGEAAVRLRQVM